MPSGTRWSVTRATAIRALQKTQPRLALHAYAAQVTLAATRYDWVVPPPPALVAMFAQAGVPTAF